MAHMVLCASKISEFVLAAYALGDFIPMPGLGLGVGDWPIVIFKAL